MRSRTYVEQNGETMPDAVKAQVEKIAASGGTPLVVAERTAALSA